MRSRFAIVLVALALAASMSAIAGCTGPTTSVQQGPEVALANGEISVFLMLDVESEWVSKGNEPNYDLAKIVDESIRIAREKPDADIAGTGRTPRQALGDAAGNIAKAYPELSKKLELAVETLPSGATRTSPAPAVEKQGIAEGDDGRVAGSTTDSEPIYSDPRWPTANPALLAIPEADRWYNSRKRIGSRGTIAGPVADMDVLKDRIMINIGHDYPNRDRAQIVIWAERWPDFQDVINDINLGDNCWVSVSGKISRRDGVAEIDVNDSRIKWRWWTDVR